MPTDTQNKMDILLDSIFDKYAALFEATIDQIYEKYYSGVDRGEFDKINQADPTSKGGKKKGKYLQWLLKLRADKKLKMEDLYKATNYLKIYNKYKNQIEENDINKIKSLPDLYGQVKDIMKSLESEEGTESLKSSKEKTKDIKKQAEKYYEDDKWLIIVPKTKEASCLYGKGTQWCTAADVSDNMFDEYNDQGPLFIMIYKPTNEKYQYHAETESFMNAEDEDVAELIDDTAGDANIDEMSENEYGRWQDEFYDIPEVRVVNSIPDEFIDKLVDDKRSIKYFLDIENRWDGVGSFGNRWRNVDPIELISKNPSMHFAFRSYNSADRIYRDIPMDQKKRILTNVISVLVDAGRDITDLNFTAGFYNENPYIFDIYLDALLGKSLGANDMIYRLFKIVGLPGDMRGKIRALDKDDMDAISRRIMDTISKMDLSESKGMYIKFILDIMSDDILRSYKSIASRSKTSYARIHDESPSPEQYAKWIGNDVHVRWDAGIPIGIPEEYLDEQVIWDAIMGAYRYGVPYDSLSDMHKGLAIRALLKQKLGTYDIGKLYENNKTFPSSFVKAHVRHHRDDANYAANIVLAFMPSEYSEYKSEIIDYFRKGKIPHVSVWKLPLQKFKELAGYIDAAGALDDILERMDNSTIARENYEHLMQLKKADSR